MNKQGYFASLAWEVSLDGLSLPLFLYLFKMELSLRLLLFLGFMGELAI
jgi:hypothetical protein